MEIKEATLMDCLHKIDKTATRKLEIIIELSHRTIPSSEASVTI